MSKLLIAKYKDDIIRLEDYQESIHHGKIYCPFCSRDLRVTYNKQGYFMAWRGEGGHDCSKEQVDYFNADWEGREITEVLNNEEGKTEVIIDINSLVFSNDIFNNFEEEKKNKESKNNNTKYPRYKTKKKVFRDIIRSVTQMKKMIEKNNLAALKNIQFKFKTNKNENFSFDDITLTIDELNRSVLAEYRFVIFKVESIKWSNSKDKVYINSYTVEGINFTAALYYNEYKKSLFSKFKDNNVIAYGKISYSKKYKKYFLNLSHDFQIKKIEDDEIEELFEEKEIKSYDYKKINKENKDGKVKNEENTNVRSEENESNSDKVGDKKSKEKVSKEKVSKESTIDVSEIKEETTCQEKDGLLDKVKLFFKSMF